MTSRWRIPPVTEIPEREPLLLFVDELTRTTQAPFLVPDLRGVVTIIVEGPSELAAFSSPSIIFHALRDLEADGLVIHGLRGYSLTDAGQREADLARERRPDVAERAAEAVREAAST